MSDSSANDTFKIPQKHPEPFREWALNICVGTKGDFEELEGFFKRTLNQVRPFKSLAVTRTLKGPSCVPGAFKEIIIQKTTVIGLEMLEFLECLLS